VDVSLEDMDGLDLTRQFRTEQPGLLVLVLSMHDEVLYAGTRASGGRAGVHPQRGRDGSHVVGHPSDSARGDLPQRPVRARLRPRRLEGHTSDRDGDGQRLARREREVLRLLGGGLDAHQIAERLRLSVKTVESHCAHLKSKLSLKDGVELRRFAALSVPPRPKRSGSLSAAK